MTTRQGRPRTVRDLSTEEVVELRRLHAVARNARGQMSADDPRRLASEELTERLAVLFDLGVTYQRLGDALGIGWNAVRARLKRHGYGKLPPSRKRYQGQRASRS